jgi:membrane-associated protease RseP (regulator of RpoE activity)
MSDSIRIPGDQAGGEEPLEITAFYPPPLPVANPRLRRIMVSFGTNRPVAIALFVATCVSVFLAGLAPGGGLPEAGVRLQRAWLEGNLMPVWTGMAQDGVIFFGALMTTLMAHEMGHFLQAKRYGVPANGPYFIPFPITPFGTMGAVIVQGAGVADRKSMFDIAISGPLAGLVFALPITVIGILFGQFEAPDPGTIVFNRPLIVDGLTRLIHGPLPGHHVLHMNPWYFAGWVGIFITALNLIPIGQLDGGHILYTLIGRRAHRVAITLLFGAVAYMIMTGQPAYALMVVLLFVSGPRHPPTANDNVPLGFGRIALGWLTLAFLFVGFTPKPFEVIPDQPRPPAPQQPRERENSSELIEVRVTPPRPQRHFKSLEQRRLREPGHPETKFGQTRSQLNREIMNLASFSPGSREPGEASFLAVGSKAVSESDLKTIRRSLDSPTEGRGRAYFFTFPAGIFTAGLRMPSSTS